jgi:hypothetical protein
MLPLAKGDTTMANMAEQGQQRKRRIPKLSRKPEPGTGRYYASYRDPAGKPRRQRFSTDRTESELAYHRWVVENYDQSAAIIAPDGNIGKGDISQSLPAIANAYIQHEKRRVRPEGGRRARGTVSLTHGTQYSAKLLIDDDPFDNNLQRLRFWIDTNDDGNFTDSSPDELFLTTTAIDDTWDGGRFGFCRGSGVDDTVTQKFDNLVIEVDADGDDTYDDEAVNLDFDSAAITLEHDDNGNLTNDGLFEYTYDVLNRLVKVAYATGSDDVVVAEYEYDGMNP